jgi:hypothetical protein
MSIDKQADQEMLGMTNLHLPRLPSYRFMHIQVS